MDVSAKSTCISISCSLYSTNISERDIVLFTQKTHDTKYISLKAVVLSRFWHAAPYRKQCLLKATFYILDILPLVAVPPESDFPSELRCFYFSKCMKSTEGKLSDISH